MIYRKIDSAIIIRILAIFIIGVLYGFLNKGNINGRFIGDGLAHIIISYILGFISFYIYKIFNRKKYSERKKRKVVIWNISFFWAIFILIWLGIIHNESNLFT